MTHETGAAPVNTGSAPRPRSLPLLLGLLIGGGLVWLAVSTTDPAQVREVLAGDWDALAALAALASYLAYFAVKSLRWRLLLAPVLRIRATAVFPYVMVGYLGNLAVPLQLGEAYRGYRLARDQRANLASVLASILLEKVFDLLIVLLLLLVALRGLATDAQLAPALVTPLLAGGMVGLLAFVGILAWPSAAARLARYLTGLLPRGGVFDRLRGLLRQAARGLGILASARQTLAVLALSLLAWLMMLAALYSSMQVVGMAGSLPLAAAVLCFTVLGLTLPTSPGFVGTIQIAFVTGAVLFGADRAHALAASIVYNLLISVPPAVVALPCLIVLQRRWGHAQSAVGSSRRPGRRGAP